ncbi:MAG TPA: glutathione S-transferase family protein [Acetobacteraceae bacterium]
MTPPVLFGAEYSVYSRIARLALIEKGAAHEMRNVDVFAPGGPDADHLSRHPFGRIPVLEHHGFRLYEASAIARYADEAFPGPALQPATAQGRARMAQVVSMLDCYAFRPLVLDIFVQRVAAAPDEARIASALGAARIVLGELARFLRDGDFLAGAALSLADLHAAPMLAYFRLAPEGAAMLDEHPGLAAWLARMRARPSMDQTLFPRERAA